jgi:hypothetical protein
MEKTLEYIDTLVEEYGLEKAKEEFINSSMEDLDNFARTKKYDDVFHLTANEYIADTRIEEIDDTRKFIQYYKSETNGILKELFNIIFDNMRENKNLLPAEILGEFFDHANKRFDLAKLTLKEFLEKCDVEELKIYQKTLDIVIRNLSVDEEENCLFDDEEQKYILRVWIGEGDYLYFKFTEDEINTKMDRTEKSEYYLADKSFRDYNYIFKIRDMELSFQIEE